MNYFCSLIVILSFMAEKRFICIIKVFGCENYHKMNCLFKEITQDLKSIKKTDIYRRPFLKINIHIRYSLSDLTV